MGTMLVNYGQLALPRGGGAREHRGNRAGVRGGGRIGGSSGKPSDAEKGELARPPAAVPRPCGGAASAPGGLSGCALLTGAGHATRGDRRGRPDLRRGERTDGSSSKLAEAE